MLLYCYVPDISLLFNEWDQIKPEKRGEIALQRVPVTGWGWSWLGSSLCHCVILDKPFPLCWPHFPHQKDWVGLTGHQGPFQLYHSVIH